MHITVVYRPQGPEIEAPPEWRKIRPGEVVLQQPRADPGVAEGVVVLQGQVQQLRQGVQPVVRDGWQQTPADPAGADVLPHRLPVDAVVPETLAQAQRSKAPS